MSVYGKKIRNVKHELLSSDQTPYQQFYAQNNIQCSMR